MGRCATIRAVKVEDKPGVRSLLCTEHGIVHPDLDPEKIDAFIADPSNLLWLDIDTAAHPDLSLLEREFGFHELAIEDALRQHERSKVVEYDGYYFLVFHAIRPDADPDDLRFSQVSIFVSTNYLVTVHYGMLTQIEESAERWKRNIEKINRSAGTLLYSILDAIVDDYLPVIDRVSDAVEEIEASVFERFRQEALEEIFKLKRSLLQMRRVVSPERDSINVLLRRESPIFGADSFPYFQDIYDHLVRVTDAIDIYRDLLASAVDAYLSMSSNRLNEVMKTLTSVSIPLMTGALLAGIWGMNFEHMPELKWRLGYPMALAIITAVCFAISYYFRRRKWL
jgi:magnesium transporter